MKLIYALTLSLAMGGVGRGGELTLNPQSQHEAQKQLNGVAEETRALTDHYLEEHRQQEPIDALHDIEDAIIFDSLQEGND
jgi:hypothetical protein